jgi:hypothetical protein
LGSKLILGFSSVIASNTLSPKLLFECTSGIGIRWENFMSSIRTGEIHNMCGIVGVLSNNPNEDVNLESAVSCFVIGDQMIVRMGRLVYPFRTHSLIYFGFEPDRASTDELSNDRFWITFNGESTTILNYDRTDERGSPFCKPN